MALDHALVGVPGEPAGRTWDGTDALLYALGVGAGAEDPRQELAFTTENTGGVGQRVLPTFAVLAAQARGGPRRKLGDFDPARLVHAEQSFRLHRPLPVQGSVSVTSMVTDMLDKGRGALVRTESVATGEDGQPLVTARSGAFIMGEGGAGSTSAERSGDQPSPGEEPWTRPEREPDHSIVYRTRPDQALLYRLSGDRNPLHSDPAFAARGGFERPILHGLCTYGFTGRALLHTLCGSDPARFHAMYGRFTRPVLPGDVLVVDLWRDGAGRALFQTRTEDGTVVVDRGVAHHS
ncbi:MaoC/PaaZ C-terminal domain-containing protein [Actinomadura sp. 7K507]|uniref:MaoC/PaaZ C-terminal domain-containing protein n=1 Tax=Actinomadura sp. 7K507 TaxID=2530365 RepID=UPI0010534E61|nr:MaoC/PaaZ C-terminal domain-containing protein [Actinomadura sp. 7K507]TDC91757.1 enoyl-CoA hydratase [Actinomadura sp. 7K507]